MIFKLNTLIRETQQVRFVNGQLSGQVMELVNQDTEQ